MTGRQDILGDADIAKHMVYGWTGNSWSKLQLAIIHSLPWNICYCKDLSCPYEKEVEGSAGDTMGGELPNDSSGKLKYVRVQYAGCSIPRK